MPVVIRTKTGKEFVCDRRLSLTNVRNRIADGREGRFGPLVALEDNRTPSRTFQVDPHEVEAIWHDGHDY